MVKRTLSRLAAMLVAALVVATAAALATASAAVTSAPPLGSPTAPVTITEWGDFQCPHCAAFTRDVQPVLVREFVTPGLVRLVWRDFADRGPESVEAAVAARAAGRQGAFWPYHDYLFAHQYGENTGLWDRGFLIAAAQALRLDLPRFAADLDDPALRTAVQVESLQSRRDAPLGTPTFSVDGRVVIGAQPVEAFRAAVVGALAQVPPAPRPGRPVTRPAYRPHATAPLRLPHPTAPRRPVAHHARARPTRGPDAPRASRT